MHDSSGRFSSGILDGNVNLFGDFDQCLKVEEKEKRFKGKYCLAYVQVFVEKSHRYLDFLRKLTQSHAAFKSTFDDVSSKGTIGSSTTVSFRC